MIKDVCNILLSIIFVCQESANMKVEEVELDTLVCRYGKKMCSISLKNNTDFCVQMRRTSENANVKIIIFPE